MAKKTNKGQKNRSSNESDPNFPPNPPKHNEEPNKITFILKGLSTTSSAQLRLAQISSALIKYLTKLGSDTYLIRIVQQAQLSIDNPQFS